MLSNKINYIVHQFLPKSDIIWIKELEGGIINQTFLIRVKAVPCKEFILQQINHSVFPDVPALMSNLKKITAHLAQKTKNNKSNTLFQAFLYYPTTDGLYYYLHSDNTYWRLCDFIPHEALDNKINAKIVSEAGKLFAYFIQQLTGIDLKEIHEIIPGFHDSEKYYRDFITAVNENKVLRLDKTKAVYQQFIKFNYLIDDFVKIKNNKNIPLRLVHNDTKIDNILFDKTGQALSVIDLDTCMPGYLMSDFGDAIRSLTNTAKEDEKDLKKLGDDKIADAIIKNCIIDDTHGVLITSIGKQNRNHARKSVVEFAWTVGIPDKNNTETYIHTKIVSDAGNKEKGSASNEGQNIFHRPANHGIYAFVCNVDVYRLSYNDVTRTYPEISDRNGRYKALLSSLLNTFLNPKGAMTSTQKPHITDFEGVVSVSSNSTPAPTVSPINENYKTEIITVKDNLNKIEGTNIIEVKEFNGLGELSEIFEELIQAEPYKIS
ncbi:MAG: phosphotransferase [Bacteroidales bacterium]|nr:phosphotransferase [Bacteroidales bacterium]